MAIPSIKKSSFLLLIFLSLLFIQVAGQSNRLALVIGNKNYFNQSQLYNTVNDANSMQAALIDAGFTVYKYVNTSRVEMQEAIDEFGKQLHNYDVGLFFYAGHGIQVNGQNYLIPVDAIIEEKEKVEEECVSAQRLMTNMENSNSKTNIVILDACRQNPFARSWSRSSSTEGLAFMNAPTGSIIAFATSPGNTASDGQGKNGLYTSVLLQYMQIPNIKIEDVFKRVRSMVREKSGGSQVPWENILLEGDFYFHMGEDFAGLKDYSEEQVIVESSSATKNSFIDPRDNQEYRMVRVGDQVWMAENLNHEMDGSWCYSNSTRYCRQYGRLYSWEAAQEACPPGWRLPSDEDWMVMESFIGMKKTDLQERLNRGTDQGDLLKATGTDSWKDSSYDKKEILGFHALPAGNRNPDGSFHMIGMSAFFFTSSAYSEVSIWGRELKRGDSHIFRYPLPIFIGTSVRCVKK